MENRRNILRAALLVCLLVIPLALEWGRDGPRADRAFWIIFEYFVEIAVWIAADLMMRFIGRSNRSADSEPR